MDPEVPYVDRYCRAQNLDTLIELERELLLLLIKPIKPIKPPRQAQRTS